jgi:hypothetical protein
MQFFMRTGRSVSTLRQKDHAQIWTLVAQ